MRTILRVLMLVIIAVAVYFVVVFLRNTNDTYQNNVETRSNVNGQESIAKEEKEEANISSAEETKEEIAISGDIIESGELEEIPSEKIENAEDISQHEEESSQTLEEKTENIVETNVEEKVEESVESNTETMEINETSKPIQEELLSEEENSDIAE